MQPKEGDVAFAVSVATLYDLTIGATGWPVRLTQHGDPVKPTLTLANRVAGGPVLNILPWNWNLITPTPPPIFSIGNDGITSMQVGGHMDLLDQVTPPPAPSPTSDMLRMYHRGGQLFFQVAGIPGEQQIPIGQPPGTTLRYSFWMGGG